MKKRLITGALTLLSFASMAESYYAKKSTWADTLKSTKTSYLNALKSGKVAPLEEGAWYSTEIFKDKGRDEVMFPENGNIEITAKDAAGKQLWNKTNFKDGVINRIKFGGKAITYLYRTVKTDSDITKTVSLGSDDGIKVWLNGKVVHHNPAMRGVSPDSDMVKLDLKKGTNTVLLKIDNEGGGGYGFYYSIKSELSEIYNQLKADFPGKAKTFGRDINYNQFSNWITDKNSADIEAKWLNAAKSKIGDLSQGVDADDSISKVAQALELEGELVSVKRLYSLFKPEALEMSVKYLTRRYRDEYPNGNAYLAKIAEYKTIAESVKNDLNANKYDGFKKAVEILEFQRKAMLENPLVDFDELLVTKRKVQPREGWGVSKYGFAMNFEGNTSISNYKNIENEFVRINIRDKEKAPKTIYTRPGYLGDTDLNWDGENFLFSGIGDSGRYQIFEGNVNETTVRQVSKDLHKDVENYDPCYLPSGKIIYNSTSGYHGVPCVGGTAYVANLHVMNNDGTNIRRLCYEQDNDWYPVVKPDGQVMYLRWEYTDSAHYFSRILMTMNPDGTGQRSMYGSNSYWPNTMFYARSIPGSNSKFIAIVSGHHGVKREGELVLFDTKLGTNTADGAIQKIPGYGKKIEPIMKDYYADGRWPRFIHPMPLSDKYFITSMLMKGEEEHGVYLVDIYDNITLLKKTPGHSLFEARPIKVTKRPPIIPEKVQLDKKEGTLYIADIYQGPGLREVPRGTVKKVRVFQYEYSYRYGGGHYKIGMDGPWDVRRLIGTADVHEDGSAMFKVPANRPIALQPLDAEGKAMQQFRSWLVVMPGETLACVGCHEDANHAVPTRRSVAQQNPPQKLEPWYGPVRGFSFNREVQPVLDRNCVGCHDGSDNKVPTFSRKSGNFPGTNFSNSYWNLMKYVRRNGPEGDYSVLTPLEFHADTSRLVQLIQKNHHNVKLTDEEWDRIVTWIDLNVPFHGTWSEATGVRSGYAERRKELKKLYANVDEDIETVTFNKNVPVPEFEKPEPVVRNTTVPTVDGWPFAAKAETTTVNGIEFAKIPAGKFVKGSVDGFMDEKVEAVEIEKPFLMSTKEVTLGEFQQFAPNHINGYYDMHYKDQVNPGYNMDVDKNVPAIRVSWNQAMAYCKWLSKKLGKKVTLPTENQWEWACRAGSDKPFSYGDVNTDFSKHANLADVTMKLLAVRGVDPKPIRNPSPYWDWELKDDRFNDGVLHLAKVGSYQPNAFGLYDMHGNVAEWTRDSYSETDSKKVTRGGSWYDRPVRARSAYRLQYPEWQKVFNVGFRVIIED